MLGDPLFEVDGAPGVDALGLPPEVDLLTRSVLVGHLTPIDDVPRVAVG